MIRKYLKYHIVLFMIAALSAPISFAYETNHNNNFICKYGEDNTSDKLNFFVHCDKCVYFYDAGNFKTAFKIFLNPIIIQTNIENEKDNIKSLEFSNYQSRSPPSV